MPPVRVVIIVLAVLIAGCAAHELQSVQPDLQRGGRVASLRDGTTHRSEVVAEWGDPSAWFEQNRIMSYRLDRAYAVVRAREGTGDAPPEPCPACWFDVRYHLVLVFDSDGVLERHRLLRVR